MKEENSGKRIDRILRDIRPLQRKPAEALPDAVPSPARVKQSKRIRFPKKLVRPLFILGLAVLILGISFSSARFLTQGEVGQTSFGELKDLVGALIAIGSDLNKLKAEGFNLAFNNGGEELIATLKNLQRNLATLGAIGVGFIDGATLDTANEGLTALITLLDKPGEQRLLVLFLNPSEMRPIGGFAGSYGEVILERGSIKEIKVNDIYYPDRFLNKKIVPPRELQTVTVDWGARDAAWFFDFPTSARKTMELLEASQIYAKDGVGFDGVVALNVRIIEDILALTGPIELKEYNLTLTKDNFLEEIQQEVEEGRDKKPGENPKQVLGALAPILIERLNELDSSDKNTLGLVLFARAINKDIQFYFEDSKVEDFVKSVGWGGEVAVIDDNLIGDYLAVVNVNVAGGKTDARIEQKIKLKSEIDAGGRVSNFLNVTRQHSGKASDAAWYRTKNQNFIKVFTPADAELVSLKGSIPKAIIPQINYGAAGYSRDSELVTLERSRKSVAKYSTDIYLESGKNVFATWFSIIPGETRELGVEYERELASLASGAKYQFIFDKQSGVESALEYELVAPPGYRWQEANGSVFVYKSDSVPARLSFELTLVRE